MKKPTLFDVIEASISSLEQIGEGDWTPQDSAHLRLTQKIRETIDELLRAVTKYKYGPDMGWTHPEEAGDYLYRTILYILETPGANSSLSDTNRATD